MYFHNCRKCRCRSCKAALNGSCLHPNGARTHCNYCLGRNKAYQDDIAEGRMCKYTPSATITTLVEEVASILRDISVAAGWSKVDQDTSK